MKMVDPIISLVVVLLRMGKVLSAESPTPHTGRDPGGHTEQHGTVAVVVGETRGHVGLKRIGNKIAMIPSIKNQTSKSIRVFSIYYWFQFFLCLNIKLKYQQDL